LHLATGVAMLRRCARGRRQRARWPVLAAVDARKGRVALTSAADTGGKKLQTAQFYDGIF
jgi:hypothetical protein